MNAVTVEKSRWNRLEGVALSAVLQGLPIFSTAALVLKLVGSSAIVGFTGGAMLFVITTSIFYAIVIALLAPKFPGLFRASHEPLFFDASLSLKDKVTHWLALPKTALQLLTNVMMLSALSALAASIV